LLVTGVVPHGERQSFSEHTTERFAGRNKRKYGIVVQFEKRNDTKPRNRYEHRNLQNDSEPACDLDPAGIQVSQETQRQGSARPFPIASEAGNVVVQIIHQQNTINRVQEKRPGPVPPPALETPEISESRSHPAVEATLHGKDAVHFCGRKGNRNAPKEGNKREEDQRHSGARALKNLLIAKRAAGRIAVKQREKREKSNLAQLRPRGCHRSGIAFQSFWHRTR